jgi:hypothetical protein
MHWALQQSQWLWFWVRQTRILSWKTHSKPSKHSDQNGLPFNARKPNRIKRSSQWNPPFCMWLSFQNGLLWIWVHRDHVFPWVILAALYTHLHKNAIALTNPFPRLSTFQPFFFFKTCLSVFVWTLSSNKDILDMVKKFTTIYDQSYLSCVSPASK